MSNGNGVSDCATARKIIAHLLRHRLFNPRIPPIVRHSLHTAYGHMPGAQPVDQTLVAMFRYGHEEEKIEEIEFLLMLMEQCGRIAPIAYPDEERPDFIILPDGRKIWEAEAGPMASASHEEEDVSVETRASVTP